MADTEQLHDWSDNPRLNTWLAEQKAAFPEWAQQAGGVWDFSPGSLDRLEDLIRGLFSSWEEMAAAADDPLLSVAAWYLGEVQVRHYGTVWQCRPRPAQSPDEYDEPYVMVPESPSGTDGMDGDEDDGERDAEDCDVLCVPADELRALLLRDEDERLRDVLNRYLY